MQINGSYNKPPIAKYTHLQKMHISKVIMREEFRFIAQTIYALEHIKDIGE